MPIKRLSVLLAAPLLLGGCTSAQQLFDHTAATLGLADAAPKSYTSSETSEAVRSGVAVSDEPLAAKQGAMVLSAGGNAVDSVSTMFFTLSATYPAAAGLGAGGICLVRDTTGQVREYDFLTRAPARGGVNAVPGAVRGFYDMQKQLGRLPWQRMVGPGEAYAATGFPISQALAQRLNAASAVVLRDPVLRAEFSDNGKLLDAGSETRNLILSQALSSIRVNGADGLYKGAVAAQVEAGSAAMGGAVDQAELARQVTTITTPQSRGAGSFTTFLPNAKTGAGVFAASLMNNLRAAGLSQAGLSQAAQQALASFGVGALPQDMGSTGFAAVDASGQVAACAVTMNGPFGRSAGNTGVQLAASPVGHAGLASAFLTPLVATSGRGQIAVVGAGGPNGTAAAVYAVLEAAGGRPLGRRGDLRGTGAAPYDTVNAVSCDDRACAALSDPGAHGLGAVAQLP